jgi:Skp family chaperone for outer membrane proteins
MKNGIVLLMFVLFAGGVSSQTHLKLAHVDYMKVIDSLPSKISADKDIEAFLQNGERTLTEMQEAYLAAVDTFQAKRSTMSEIMIELTEKQLAEQQQILQIKSESLQNDLQILNERAYKPIEEKLKKAIATVAEKHGVTYVLEASNLLYIGQSLDLTAEVRAEMLRLDTQP